MATTANVTITVVTSGDIVINDSYKITENTASPAQSEYIDLASGTNTITLPTGGSATVVGVIIIPPAGNTNLIIAKGVTGDTGIPLHLTNPSFIALDTTEVAFDLNGAAAITGVRLIYV